MSGRLAVCSWSLRPGSPEDLAERVLATGLRRVQLALKPLRLGEWKLGRTLDALRGAGVSVCSGMLSFEGEDYATLESIRVTGGLRPDRAWRRNLKAAEKAARLARQLDVDLVSFHAGFLPEDRADPLRATMVERLRDVVDALAEQGVRAALETGQESTRALLDVLDELERPSAGVNFDPANLLLYDRDDPVEALRALAPRVFQLHVKDARRTRVAGTWGTEVAAGTGEVDWDGLFDVVAEALPDVDLVIEREAGDDRVGDVRTAAELVRAQLARTGGGS